MQLDYTQLFIKFALGILTLIIQINVFGKSNLAPTTALDQLQNYVLGGIIGGLIYNPSITILQFFLVLIVWTLVVFILMRLSLFEYSKTISAVLSVEQSSIINISQFI